MGQQGEAARAVAAQPDRTFSSLDLSPSTVGHDMLGDAYEYLLKQFADESGKKAGEFFTPAPSCGSSTRILDPQPTRRSTTRRAVGWHARRDGQRGASRPAADPRTLRLFGQEVNLTTSAIARMNLFLHDIEDVRILRGDTLRDPKFRDDAGRARPLRRGDRQSAVQLEELGRGHVDAPTRDVPSAACRPPATATSHGSSTWSRRCDPSTGRVGVVMPHGVLFRGGAEGAIRQCLSRRISSTR